MMVGSQRLLLWFFIPRITQKGHDLTQDFFFLARRTGSRPSAAPCYSLKWAGFCTAVAASPVAPIAPRTQDSRRTSSKIRGQKLAHSRGASRLLSRTPPRFHWARMRKSGPRPSAAPRSGNAFEHNRDGFSRRRFRFGHGRVKSSRPPPKTPAVASLKSGSDEFIWQVAQIIEKHYNPGIPWPPRFISRTFPLFFFLFWARPQWPRCAGRWSAAYYSARGRLSRYPARTWPKGMGRAPLGPQRRNRKGLNKASSPGGRTFRKRVN